MFKEIPEFQSFKGRIELMRVPYLLDYEAEQQDLRGAGAPTAPSGKHIAPHTAYVAALWAVLTRMRKPLPEKYPKGLADLVAKLTPLEKAELYAHGRAPDGLSPEQTKELVGNIDKIWGESDAYPNYEGRTGASPREIKTLLLNAAQNAKFACVSPLAVFEEMEELVKNVTVYEFLKQEPLPGGYHENKKFIDIVREQLPRPRRRRGALVDGPRRGAAVRATCFGATSRTSRTGSRRRSCATRSPGGSKIPTRSMMAEVEKTLGMRAEARRLPPRGHLAHRRLVDRASRAEGRLPARSSRASCSSCARPTSSSSKKILKKTTRRCCCTSPTAPTRSRRRFDREAFERVETTLRNLQASYGYCEHCARDAVSYLLRKRYS